MSRSDPMSLAADARIAIYAAPSASDPLWAFGSSTIGYDATSGRAVQAPPPLGLSPERWLALTDEPRRYGFHATLKAPFRLAEGVTFDAVSAEVATFASTTNPPPAFALTVRAIGPFLALVPVEPPAAMHALADEIVSRFDGYRAPLTDAERAKRHAAGLTARQSDYLERFGYPYVREEFRFHMTLTGKIADASLREELRAALAERHAREVGDIPFSLDALVLFVQTGAGAPFAVRERHQIGSAAGARA